jgi:methylmalonyl-CoA mutase
LGARNHCTRTARRGAGLPTDFSARIARNTQLTLQLETGITHVVDPWAGSYYVERLTHELMHKAWGLIEEIERLGGMAKAIETGVPKMRIEEAAARRQASIDAGRDVIVGVNAYPAAEEPEIPVLDIDNDAVRTAQVKRLEQLKRERDASAVREALEKLGAFAANRRGKSAGLRGGRGAQASNTGRDFDGSRKRVGALRGNDAHHRRRVFR